MSDCNQYHKNYTRRDFLNKTSLGLGAVALAGLMNPLKALGIHAGDPILGPHFSPKVKRVIYLFQSGAPSQIDLFDYKPELMRFQGQDIPDSIRKGQRLTGMSAGQKRLPIAPSPYSLQTIWPKWSLDERPHALYIKNC